ncbi:fluoride efflux transporter CrcB [Aerophototrophica crusticola]|uniref:Fluoride-specific ion channel FluC n=1 Tax=Aerophototrophica crusticola TaxID=1709002 RepID=A0A858R752_9PROT|nr:fluoride efflux transporter CrcB [Rhodospirillaceae bacterium B3]
MKMLLAIALGGAVGSVLRYLAITWVGQGLGAAFPYGTLAVNIVGSVVMGVLVQLSALVWSPGAELRAFLTVGVLGGFTTFSSFSLDVALLAQRGEVASATIYVVLSVLLSVGGLFAGMWATRVLVAG